MEQDDNVQYLVSSPKGVTKIASDTAEKEDPKSCRKLPRNLLPLFRSAAETENADNGMKVLSGSGEPLKTGSADTQVSEDGKLENTTKREHSNHDGDSDEDSVQSLRASHGKWDGNEDVPYHGCVCGETHARPIAVFWIQCEGPCQAWFNVTPSCVNGLTLEEAEKTVWQCNHCTDYFKEHRSFQTFVDLPPDLHFRILEFAAKRTYRAAVLQTQIAPVCRAARHFVKGDKSKGLWELILHRDYYLSQPSKKMMSESPIRRRCSKRRRKCSYSHSSAELQSHPRFLVQEEHLQLLSQIEEAYVAVESLADPLNGHPLLKSQTNYMLLTLQRLRRIITGHQPLDLNRPSNASGRTFLQVCCAAEANEAVIVRCVRYLIEQGADPNVFSVKEEPYANRPTLYFAISRAMPHLVEVLIDAKASLTVQVSGAIQLTFDTSKSLSGTFTPLEYAREMKRAELVNSATTTEATAVPPYWVSKMSACVRVLEKTTNR